MPMPATLTSDLIWLAVLVLLLVSWTVIRPVVGFVFGPKIAAKALAAQPDTIHLEPCPDTTWDDAATRDRLSDEIAGFGFREAGSFTVRELPGVRIRLFANAPDSAYAVYYEHPRAGTWFDFTCRFTDGSSSTWTTARDTGLASRPGHPVRHVRNATAGSLWKCVTRERPARPAQPASVEGAVADFENAWAESIAWRKGRGVSRGEVAKVAMRKAA